MTKYHALFQVGQQVYYKNDDFDAVTEFSLCVVKSIFDDHIIITELETNTDFYIQEGFNLGNVYPEYNMPLLQR